MTDDLRTLLTRVATGEISPEDAHSLLRDHAAGTATAPVAVARVAVRGRAVKLTVIADPTVDTAVAEGPHRVERDGDRLVIHSDLSQGEYTAETPRSSFMTWVNAGLRAGAPLRVRVNPRLPLEVLLVAGSLELSGQQAPVSIGVEAGSARISGGRGPIRLSVSTGSADLAWQFVDESSVSAEMGSVQVTAQPGSDVRIAAESSAAGSVQVRTPEGTQKSAAGRISDVVVGAGTGRLTVSAKLGSAAVTVS